MKKLLCIVLSVLTMTLLASCALSKPSASQPARAVVTEIEELEFVNDELAVKEGDKVNLYVKQDIDSSELNWMSSDTTVAKVENGMVMAVSEGEATITVQYKELTDTCTVTVKPDPREIVTDEVETTRQTTTKAPAQRWNDDYDDYYLGYESIKNDLGGEAYLDQFSEFEIQAMINEILARNHYEFQTEEWFDYFSDYDWYTYDTSSMKKAESRFSKIESENYNYLASYRNKYF